MEAMPFSSRRVVIITISDSIPGTAKTVRRHPSVQPAFSHGHPLPTRKDLATILKRLMDADYPLTGLSDHGVSEAIYLNDPDGNGVELYWDRPKEDWPRDEKGELHMFTEALNVKSLMAELDR
jgi:catechol 2,3-dioxygenase